MGKGKVISKLMPFLKRYLPALCISLVLAGVYVAMSLYIPILVGKAVDCIIEEGRVDFTAMGKELNGVLICAAVAGIAQWVMNTLNNRITYGVTRDIRDAAFRHIQVLPLSYLDAHPRGELVSRVVSDVDTLADGLLMGFSQLFTGVMTIVGTLLLMLSISWQIALVVVLITPLSLVVASFIAKSTYNMFREQTVTRGQQTALIDETVGQLKVVKAFGHEEASLGQFDRINDRL